MWRHFTLYHTKWTADGSVFWHRQSVFCLCMKYLGNRWTDLRHIHTRRRVWSVARTSLKVKVKDQRSRSPGTKRRHFSAVSAACVRFMFGKTSLASSYLFIYLTWTEVLLSLLARSIVRALVHNGLKPNSITLASSELAPNMFGTGSEPASVMEFGREPASSC